MTLGRRAGVGSPNCLEAILLWLADRANHNLYFDSKPALSISRDARLTNRVASSNTDDWSKLNLLQTRRRFFDQGCVSEFPKVKDSSVEYMFSYLCYTDTFWFFSEKNGNKTFRFNIIPQSNLSSVYRCRRQSFQTSWRHRWRHRYSTTAVWGGVWSYRLSWQVNEACWVSSPIQRQSVGSKWTAFGLIVMKWFVLNNNTYIVISDAISSLIGLHRITSKHPLCIGHIA